MAEFFQPIEVAELAAHIIDAKDKSVFNPFSGPMSYATTLRNYARYTGVEITQTVWELTQFRIYLAGLEQKADCKHGDALNWVDSRYDIIVSTPPIGMNVSLDGVAGQIKIDWVYLKKFEETTTDNGVMFTCCLPSVLFDGSSKCRAIRKELTEKNFLDAVIELPTNLFPHTSISMVALVLKKCRKANDPVKMIDASSLFTGKKRTCKLNVDSLWENYKSMTSENCTFVTVDDIRANDYIWYISKYLRNQTSDIPEGYEALKLEEVAELVRGKRSFNDKKGHLAKIADLSSEGADCIRTVESFEVSDDLARATKITEPVILLSTIRILKPTYCEASQENPIFLYPNVCAIRIKQEWVSPTYLCLELSRRNVIAAGVVIPHINRSELMGMLIAFPSINSPQSLEEQRRLYMQASDNLKMSKAKELDLQSVIDRMKAEYINIVRTRKHDMKPYMRELKSISQMMRSYVTKYGSSELQGKMENLLNLFEDAYRGLSSLVDVFSQEEEFGTPEKLNIDRYLRAIAKGNDVGLMGYSIDYYCDDNALQAFGLPYHKVKSKEISLLKGFISFKAEMSNSEKDIPLFVDIAKSDIDRVFNNIMDNARIHGFTDRNRIDYQIEINLTVVPERNMFQIDISNNGTQLPKGMTKDMYGLLGEKAGKTGKTGQGGYIVKSIVEHYHGDYDVFTEDGKTVIRILLPISKEE